MGFEGDLPGSWTGALKGVMEGDGEGVKFMAVRGGGVVEVEGVGA